MLVFSVVIDLFALFLRHNKNWDLFKSPIESYGKSNARSNLHNFGVFFQLLN